MITFTCRSCNTPLRLPDRGAGTNVSCPSCGQRLLVPGQPVDEDQAVDILLALDAKAPTPPAAASGDKSRSIRCTCPHCRTAIKAGASKAGARVKCPKCKLPFEVPVPTAELRDTPHSAGAVKPPPALAPKTAASEGWGAPSVARPATVAARPTAIPKKGRSLALWLGICCGGLFFLCCGGLGLIVLLDRHDSKHDPVAQSPSPAGRMVFTEAAARDQLKKALDSWVAGETAQDLAQRHPDVEFAEPKFTDRALVLAYDIEQTNFYESLGTCDIRVSIRYPQVGGGEGRYSRFYDVKKPDEKGTWRITVSPYTPTAPEISKAPLVTEARDRLKIALDGWVAGTWKTEFAKKQPSIDFVDLDYSDTKIIVRYDIGTSEGPGANGTWTFNVFLVFLSVKGTEFRVHKCYEVDRPNERGVWHIRGYKPNP